MDQFEAIEEKVPDEFMWAMERFGTVLQGMPTNNLPFAKFITRIVESAIREGKHLGIGHRNSPRLLAWACRNLLELNVITHYTLLSPENWREFSDDMWVDGREIFESSRRFLNERLPGVEMPEIDEAIANLRQKTAETGIENRTHISVSKLAQAHGLPDGMATEYKQMMTLTSKFVHQTAFILLAFENTGELSRIPHMIFTSGRRYLLEIYRRIREHVDTRGMEP